MKAIESILFVCMGNICRSPSAEAVMRSKSAQKGLAISIDSAGTISYHQGQAPDDRSVAAGVKRGLSFDNMRARQVTQADFEHFDLILAADKQNLRDLQARCPVQHHHKLALMLAYHSPSAINVTEVPDPYYGEGDGFERVLDLLESSCENLVELIIAAQLSERDK